MTEGTTLAPGLGDARRRRGMLFLGLAVGGVSFVMAMQMGLNANFLADDIRVTPDQLGTLEAFREGCGVVAFGILALLAGLAEPIVGAAMILLLGAGLAAFTFTHEYTWIVVMSVVWSQGLHVWMPLPSSMALSLAEPGRTGHRLGQIGAAGSAGFALGLAVAFILTKFAVPMRPMYLVAGGVAVLAAGACLGIPRNLKTPGPRLILRRRYGLYYLLCFLDGWRKQIFLCFAGFLLVRVYKTPLLTMLILWGIVQVIGYVAAPRVGRLIDRVGERKILVIYFTTLIFVFIGYATIENVWWLYGLFMADSALFILAMALTTYVNRIAPPAEHTPTLSMGVAMNHVAAMTMPLLGGILWTHWGYRWPFVLGAVAAALSILAALRVPYTPKQAQAPAPPASGGNV